MAKFAMRPILLCTALFGIWCSSCDKPDPPQVPGYVQELENLTVYPAGSEPVSQIELEREQIFGDTGEIFIGWLNAVTVDNTGRVYLADGEKLDIKVYQPDGKYLESIGGEGDGPGEFRSITTLKTISDRLVVLDENRQQIHWFSTENYYLLNSVQMDPAVDDMEVARVSDFFVRTDQSLLLQFSKMNTPDDRVLHYSLLDHFGEIMAGNILELRDADIFSYNTDEFPVVMVLPFARNTLVAASQTNGIYTASNHDFLVKKYDVNGEYNRAFYYPFKNEELIRSDVLDMYGEHFRRAVQHADFPETWPALNEMLIDDENRLWISTITDNFDIYEWWVLEETGELITKFEWSRDEPIEVVKNGYMYTRETDEKTGLQQVVRYRFEMD